jgi:hypothetical protein
VVGTEKIQLVLAIEDYVKIPSSLAMGAGVELGLLDH